MNQDIIFNIIASVVAILGVGKIFYEISISNKTKLRDEYKFSKDFFIDLHNENEKLHPYSIEKGYQAIAGTSKITGKEVSYLLSLENPGLCIKDYVLAKEYLEFVEIIGKKQIIFAKKYKNKNKRMFLKICYVFMYFLFAYLSLSPILFPNFFGLDLYQSVKYFLFTLLFFGYFAFTSIQCFAKLLKSEKLINNQSQHSKLVICM